MSPAPAYVAYYRVSTVTQGRSGLGLAAQRRSVGEYVAQKGGALIGEYEEWEGGHKPPSARPALAAAIEHSQRTGARLLVARLDRLARSVLVIANLMRSKVDFVAVDLPEANSLTIHIFAAMAEYERRLIGARIRDMLRAYKARGGVIGLARLEPDERRKVVAKGLRTLAARAQAFADRTMPTIREMQAAGIDHAEDIARALNRRGIPTATGRGPWWGSSVRRLVRRADPASILVRPGRKKEQADRILSAMQAENRARAAAFAVALMPTIDDLRAGGVTTWRGLAKELTDRHIPTARNRGPWKDTTLKKIVARGERVRAGQ